MFSDGVWPDDPAGFVLAKGRAGLSRVEIAAAMGATLAAPDGRARAAPVSGRQARPAPDLIEQDPGRDRQVQ